MVTCVYTIIRMFPPETITVTVSHFLLQKKKTLTVLHHFRFPIIRFFSKTKKCSNKKPTAWSSKSASTQKLVGFNSPGPQPPMENHPSTRFQTAGHLEVDISA